MKCVFCNKKGQYKCCETGIYCGSDCRDNHWKAHKVSHIKGLSETFDNNDDYDEIFRKMTTFELINDTSPESKSDSIWAEKYKQLSTDETVLLLKFKMDILEDNNAKDALKRLKPSGIYKKFSYYDECKLIWSILPNYWEEKKTWTWWNEGALELDYSVITIGKFPSVTRKNTNPNRFIITFVDSIDKTPVINFYSSGGIALNTKFTNMEYTSRVIIPFQKEKWTEFISLYVTGAISFSAIATLFVDAISGISNPGDGLEYAAPVFGPIFALAAKHALALFSHLDLNNAQIVPGIRPEKINLIVTHKEFDIANVLVIKEGKIMPKPNVWYHSV